MDEIIKRYRGKTTSQGHKLEVTREGDELHHRVQARR